MELDRSLKTTEPKLSWLRICITALIILAVIAAWHMLSIRASHQAEPFEPAVRPATNTAPPVASMQYLPAEVREALVALCGGCTFADSNGPWNPTDLVDENLPQRRLTKTERRGSEWFIQYQHGGIFIDHVTVVLSATPAPVLQPSSSCVPSKEQACYW